MTIRLVRNLYILFIVLFITFTVVIFWNLEQRTRFPVQSYSDFLGDLKAQRVKTVELKGTRLTVTVNDGTSYSTEAPDAAAVAEKIEAAGVHLTVVRDWTNLAWYTVLFFLAITVFIITWVSMSRRQEVKGQEAAFASRKMIHFAGDSKITLDDVAGVDEAKYELREVISFLRDPEPFQRIGAVIPRGILLQGPPGTGKTMLAKAIAGESGVPFYSISGSDFVEKYVGVGASRIRELFVEARKNTPCIIFIDEIDAVGANRAAGDGQAGQDERGQTLNALLVEMDGFSSAETVLVLAATNRPDILDPALRRPGRFDRQISILPPDVKGRKKILEVHGAKVRLSAQVDLDHIAQTTPGFTGAELHNLINEAALLAARNHHPEVLPEDFEAAKDRIMLGVERKGLVLSETDRRILAYHEAGHAILARSLPEADPLFKITIIPRGEAMGQTQQLPLSDRHAYTRDYLLTRITILMGGKAAEDIIFHESSTGASQDLQQATEIAIAMVCKWGMGNHLAPRSFVRESSGFLAVSGATLFHSQQTEEILDQEINSILRDCYNKARELLEKDEDFLRNLAEILLKSETLDSEELDIIFECTLKKRDSLTNGSQQEQACTI